MHLFFQNRTIQLLGLEHDIWDRISDQEKYRYFYVWICYIGFVTASLISGIFMMYLLTSDWFWAIPLGLFLAFVLSNVFRFSLVILRRSVFDEEKAKQKRVWNLSFQNIIARIRETINGWRIFSKKQSNSVDENEGLAYMGSFIRFSILSILSLLIIFPLASVMQFSQLEEINQQKRDQYLQEYREDLSRSAGLQSGLIKKSIKEAEVEMEKIAAVSSQTTMYEQKKQQIQQLRNELASVEISEHSAIETEIGNKTEKTKKLYFIVYSFRYVSHTPFFLFSLLLITWLIWMPHLILYRLKNATVSRYADLSTQYYKQLIEAAYMETEAYKKELLLDRYGFDVTESNRIPYWKNQPYCTVKNNPFSNRKTIKSTDFVNQIGPSI